MGKSRKGADSDMEPRRRSLHLRKRGHKRRSHTLFCCRSAPPSPCKQGSSASAWSCGLIIFIEHRMYVHEPVHGMQGVLEIQSLWVLTFCPPMQKFRQATESEGEAFRMFEARRSASLRPASTSAHARVQGVSEMYRGRPSMASRIFAGCPSFGYLSWARKKGDKEKASPFQEVHDPCFFSAPQFTDPRRHALMLPIIILFCCRSAPPSPCKHGSAASAVSCGLIIFIEHRMYVREPVHGMQGVLEIQSL